ncbi:MAG: diphthine--ammonia ligase [Candidatus Woesearchaeota archaeon]
MKSSNAIAHCLHALVGFVPQPLLGKSGRAVLAANCEVYNWKEIDSRYGLGASNDSDMILKLLEKKGTNDIISLIDEFDGPFAFAYWKGDKVFLCRDIFGIKPLWYSLEGGVLAFASERKSLDTMGVNAAKEMNPREVIVYDLKKRTYRLLKRDFFSVKPEIKESKESILKELAGLTVNAVSKRIPDEKFGILFSGGIDSTLLAKVCKDLGVDFTCYTAALESDVEAEDLKEAKRAAAEMGLKLKFKTLKLGEVEEYLKKLVPLIEDNNVVKVGVGLTFYVACELAKKDGVRVIFSGLGSEDLFAGYERHKKSSNVNNECVSGLLKMYERDLYRDDVITMDHNIELRVPFLDKRLAEYSLRIPAKYKLDAVQNKKIIREVAENLGVPREFAQRKKRAAQYGSRFDKAIDILSRRAGLKSKSAYLDRFYSRNPSLGVMFSSGKDSAYAMWVMQKQNYPIRCLIMLKSKNPDSYMFHTPNIDLVVQQGGAMNIPVVVQETEGEKEKELADLKKALATAKRDYNIDGVVTGALYSQYQRERIEKVCDSLGLKIFSPLWHMDQEKEMRQLVDEGFDIVFSSIAAEGLDKSWLGRRITGKDVDKLVALKKKIGLNVAGEGGEFESLVLDAPMFHKRIEILESQIIEESDNIARFIVKKVRMVKK